MFFFLSVEKENIKKKKMLEREGRELAEGTKCWPVESPLVMMEAKSTLEPSETMWV